MKDMLDSLECIHKNILSPNYKTLHPEVLPHLETSPQDIAAGVTELSHQMIKDTEKRCMYYFFFPFHCFLRTMIFSSYSHSQSRAEGTQAWWNAFRGYSRSAFTGGEGESREY